MSIIFRSADDEYRTLKSRYAHELKRLLRTGEMTRREYEVWRDDSTIDAGKFPAIKTLWDQLESTYPQTRAGLAEAKATTGDSLIPLPTSTASTVVVNSALDESLTAVAPTRLGKTQVTEFAASLNTEVGSFLDSFRRVRTKLVGVRAFECMDNGQLCIEIIEGSDND